MTEPKDTATRQREWRARRKAEGYRMTTVWLDPDTAKLLEKMVDKHCFTPPNAAKQDIINRAIGHYAKSLDYKV